VLYAKALCINVSAVALSLWWLQGPATANIPMCQVFVRAIVPDSLRS
jgi:hypothetical protein